MGVVEAFLTGPLRKGVARGRFAVSEHARQQPSHTLDHHHRRAGFFDFDQGVDEVGVTSTGDVRLLPVDDKFVAVGDSPGVPGCVVGLGEAKTPAFLAGEHGFEEQRPQRLVDVGGDVVSNGPVQSTTGRVDIDGTDDVTTNQTVTAASTVEITTENGNVTVNQATESTGADISINAGGNVTTGASGTLTGETNVAVISGGTANNITAADCAFSLGFRVDFIHRGYNQNDVLVCQCRRQAMMRRKVS